MSNIKNKKALYIFVTIVLIHSFILFNVITILGTDDIKEIIKMKLLSYFIGFIVPAFLGLILLPLLFNMHLITICYSVFAVVNLLYTFWMKYRPLSEDGKHYVGEEYIFWYYIFNNVFSMALVLIVKIYSDRKTDGGTDRVPE
jgi:hypothetical protein